mgnify:CR=1 FL=1
MKNDELSIDDLIAASGALESWVDAFQDDEENDEAIERVKRVMSKLNAVIANAQATGRHLRLVKPGDE